MAGFVTSRVAAARGRCWIAAILGLVLIAAACGSPAASLEERAQAIDQTLMCPVCPSETIDQSQVPIALQMRQRVRDMLADGATRDEIYDHFKVRYGETVLAAPSKGGANLTVWIVPPVGLVVGAVVLMAALRAMRRTPDLEEESGGGASEASLASYLEQVDSDLDADNQQRGAV